MEIKLITAAAMRIAKISLSCLLIAYISGYFYISYFNADPYEFFKKVSFNTRLTEPIRESARHNNIDNGIVIFIHNSTAAILFIAPLFLAASGYMKRIFHDIDNTPSNKPGIRLLSMAAGLAQNSSQKLINLASLLTCTNRLAMGIIFLLVGFAIAAGGKIFGNQLLIIPWIFPHGILELTAAFFAAGLPLALFAFIKTEIDKNSEADTFILSRRFTGSRPVIIAITGIFIALFIAGQIEAKVSPKALKYFQNASAVIDKTEKAK